MAIFLDTLVPIFGILGIFGMPAFIVWVALRSESKKRELFHTTLQKLIDSGQVLTPELMQSIPGYVEGGGKINDIKAGSILMAVGVGVSLIGLIGLGSMIVFASGLLVVLLGGAFLAYGIYEKMQQRDEAG